MDPLEVCFYGAIPDSESWFWQFCYDIGPGKPHLFILAIGEGDELPFLQPKKFLRPYLAYLPLPFGNPGIKIQGILSLAYTLGRPFNDFKKAFVISGGIGVVGLPKELVGKVAQNGPAGLVPVHHIVLYLVLEHINGGNVITS
tara:strand:+ start:2166 stop:2594 length:429 start_codon:yes stop_codon:yes gene_type:complete